MSGAGGIARILKSGKFPGFHVSRTKTIRCGLAEVTVSDGPANKPPRPTKADREQEELGHYLAEKAWDDCIGKRSDPFTREMGKPICTPRKRKGEAA